MKFIIAENRLHDVIYKFIDDYMRGIELEWYFGQDRSNPNKQTEHEVIFTDVNYRDGDDYTPIFTWVSKDYFTEQEKDSELIGKYVPLSPFLEISSYSTWRKKMDSFFGDVWRPVFEDWFRNSFERFPVKTFIYLVGIYQ